MNVILAFILALVYAVSAQFANCPSGKTYSAILFEGRGYSGIKHWIDGKSGECRGLSGAGIGSIAHVTSVGGSQIVPNAIAQGVTLRFYNNVNCQGGSFALAGNVQSTAIGRAMSVRIECNGRVKY